MSGVLTVFRGLPIPVSYAATMKYATLAKSNGGKTYLAMKFEEQMCDAGMFFVVLDPVGKHWALRAGADGSEKGGKRDVYVLGGLHGDVELSPTSGALIADTVVDHPGRYVLDVSTFETDGEQDRFATDFAKRLFRRKAKDPGVPLMVVLEEAESFIPQVAKGHQALMLGAFGRIARQGRNHGIGLYMVSQRAAALNKGVLSQADVLIVKEMSHKRDRDSIDDWVEANGTREERDTLLGSLASLDVDEAWVWSPAWLKCFTRTKVLKRVTFDSSASIEHGASMKSVELTPLDVEALGKHIAQTAERAKADDPKELRKRITDLERLLHTAERVRNEATAETAAAVERALRDTAAFDGEEYAQVLTRLEDAGTELAAGREAVQELEAVFGPLLSDRWVDHLEGTRERVVDAARLVAAVRPVVAEWGGPVKAEALHRARQQHVPALPSTSTPRRSLPAKGRREGGSTPYAPRSPQPARSAPETGESNGTLKRAERRILAVLAQFPDGRTTIQLAMLTGYRSTSGGYKNALAKLRSAELIDRGNPVRITGSGQDAIEGQYEPLPEGEELWRYWLGQVKLAERTVLEALRDRGPMTAEELAETTGYSPTSGGFKNALSRLRTLELIERGQPIELGAEIVEAVG